MNGGAFVFSTKEPPSPVPATQASQSECLRFGKGFSNCFSPPPPILPYPLGRVRAGRRNAGLRAPVVLVAAFLVRDLHPPGDLQQVAGDGRARPGPHPIGHQVSIVARDNLGRILPLCAFVTLMNARFYLPLPQCCVCLLAFLGAVLMSTCSTVVGDEKPTPIDEMSCRC